MTTWTGSPGTTCAECKRSVVSTRDLDGDRQYACELCGHRWAESLPGSSSPSGWSVHTYPSVNCEQHATPTCAPAACDAQDWGDCTLADVHAIHDLRELSEASRGYVTTDELAALPGIDRFPTDATPTLNSALADVLEYERRMHADMRDYFGFERYRGLYDGLRPIVSFDTYDRATPAIDSIADALRSLSSTTTVLMPADARTTQLDANHSKTSPAPDPLERLRTECIRVEYVDARDYKINIAPEAAAAYGIDTEATNDASVAVKRVDIDWVYVGTWNVYPRAKSEDVGPVPNIGQRDVRWSKYPKDSE